MENIKKLDRIIHEPSRLLIMAVLISVKEADFKYLLLKTGLTKGNLSVHSEKLEKAGFIKIEKKFDGKKPKTIYRITDKGMDALKKYLKLTKDFIKNLEEKKA